jgi:hypothetical protein
VKAAAWAQADHTAKSNRSNIKEILPALAFMLLLLIIPSKNYLLVIPCCSGISRIELAATD